MQSVLEALGTNLVTSPKSKTPPLSSSSLITTSPSLTDVANTPTKDHFYDTIPLFDTSQTDDSSTTQPPTQLVSSPSGYADNYIYDTVPLRNRLQPAAGDGESHYAVPRLLSNSPAVSPRTRRRGSQPITQHHTVQSPSLDQRHSHYDVPRPASRSSISPPQSSPVQGSPSNKHRSHYDVPIPTNSTCVSPPQSSPTQSPSWSSSPVNEPRPHYDVPSRPVPASRRPPSQVTQQHVPTTVVTTQESSPVQMRRSSSDSTVLDTVPQVTPPPVRPRPSPNASRRIVHTIDRTSGLSMNNLVSELKARTSTMSTGKPNS